MTQPNELIETMQMKINAILTDDSLGAVGRKYDPDYHVQLKTKLYELLEEDFPSLLSQLQQTREELEAAYRWIENLKKMYKQERAFSDAFQRERDSLQAELEQVKAERDELRAFWKEITIDQAKDYIKSVESLRAELSAKDKALEAVKHHCKDAEAYTSAAYAHFEAHKVLSQYKGESTHENK